MAEQRDVPLRGTGGLLTRPFLVVTTAALFYFLGLGILAPVVPRYVEEVLGGGGTEVGLAVGIFAVSAAVLRPWVGRIGDQRGRRVLVVGGATAAGLSILGYGLHESLAVLLVMRLISGAGEAATFVGAATTAQDLAPEDRRGQAASYFSIAVYGGIAAGPPLGEWLFRQHGPDAAWFAAGTCCLLGAAIGLAMPRRVPRHEPLDAGHHRSFFQRDAIRPGIVLALGAAGFAGFSAFVPLYVDEIGIDGAGAAFSVYAVLVLGVRIFGSRLPDRLGPRRAPLLALGLQAAGLVALGLWASPVGLYASTAVYAAGVSLLYPALFPLVIANAPDAERSHAVGTFTLFFDLSQGLGAPLLGIVVAATGAERPAFVVAGGLSALGWILHRHFTRP